MGGSELRGALLAQVQLDLNRCHDTLTMAQQAPEQDCDLLTLCKTAHEVKGLAATIGAFTLAETAMRAELACTSQDVAALAYLLPELTTQTGQAGTALAALAKED